MRPGVFFVVGGERVRVRVGEPDSDVLQVLPGGGRHGGRWRPPRSSSPAVVIPLFFIDKRYILKGWVGHPPFLYRLSLQKRHMDERRGRPTTPTGESDHLETSQ